MGVVTLYRQFYDGNIIAIEAGAHGSNGGDEDVEMYGVFRHTITNKSLDEKEVYMPSKTVTRGVWYGPYESGLLDFGCNGIAEGDTWNSDAYIRLVVKGALGRDSYHINKTIDFTEDYNFNSSD